MYALAAAPPDGLPFLRLGREWYAHCRMTGIPGMTGLFGRYLASASTPFTTATSVEGGTQVVFREPSWYYRLGSAAAGVMLPALDSGCERGGNVHPCSAPTADSKAKTASVAHPVVQEPVESSSHDVYQTAPP